MTNASPVRGSFAAMFEASRQLSHDVAPRQVRLSAMEPNPQQPRTHFDAAALEELAESIRSHGLLQPVIVRPHPAGGHGRYEIVAGERRYHASKLAGLESIPVIIRSLDDSTARQVALIENLQRENITPLEEALVLKQILDETAWSHRQLGEKLGKSKTYIEQRVRLLRYPPDVQLALGHASAKDSDFTPGHAKAVVQLKQASARATLIGEIQAQGLSVRQAEQRVQRVMAATAKESQPVTSEPDNGRQPAPVHWRTLQTYRLVEEARESGVDVLDWAELQEALKHDLGVLRRG
ncbi:MAG: ParB/RepB/Spo0J family partition protein [Candidatus Sericytochromatia bacterium]|nr:ParB/RepB/Spo0J family partition protein [Candidatus Sericytochromatia bacterium]